MKHIFFVEDDLSLISGLSFALKKFDFAAAFLAVYAPSRRIRDMAITDTINEL